MAVEIELKLSIAPTDIARLRRHPLLAAVKPVRRKLYGIYFDTPDFDLFRRKSAFRLRREGFQWVQTVKLDRSSVGGLSMRPEYEVLVSGNRPDCAVLPPEARAALTTEIEARLAPVFVTDFQRTTWLVAQGDLIIEVALDLGHVRAGETDLPVAEVELELKAGNGTALFDLAASLLHAAHMIPEYRSKALRGYALAGVWAQAPVRAKTVPVDRGMSATEAWRLAMSGALAQLGHNLPGLIEEDDPEYVHQTRVAVRRLRTLLNLGRSLGLDHAGWSDELRWFMGELSLVRDWDVLVTQTLAAVSGQLSDPERLDNLVSRAEKARGRARRRAQLAASDRRLAALMLDMGRALLVERSEGSSLTDWENDVLDRRLCRFIKPAREFADLDATGRHDVRIAAKRLRYAGEVFASLHDKRASRYLDRLADVQDRLGLANDAIVARRLLADLNRDGKISLACGFVEGVLAAHATMGDGKLAELVRKFVRARPFWR